jgi:hypothetical protein
MGNRKNLPQPGKPNPALSLNAQTFYRKKIAPPPASLTERNRQYYTSYLNDPACDVKPGYVAIGYYYRRFGIDYEQDFTLYHRRPDDPTFDFARRHPDDPIWTLMSETKTWLCGRWFSLHERPIAITNTP